MMKTIHVNLFVVLLIVGCAVEPSPPMVYVKCPSGVSLMNTIDLSMFGAFKPGIRFAEATAQFGEPKRTWTGSNGTVYQLYTSPQADVAVAKETQVSGGMPKLEWWTVFAFPPTGTNAFSPAKLLSPDVQTRLKKQQPPCQLAIHGSNDDNGVWCEVTADGITEIRWLNSDSKK